MKVWALAVLLMAAVLAEKALARPNEAADDEKDYQEDGHDYDQDDERRATSTSSRPPAKLKSTSITRTARPGDTVQFPCEVENAPGNLVWLNKSYLLFNGKAHYTFKDDPRPSVFLDHTLQIENVQPRDSGTYTCKVTEGVMVTHYLNVFEPPRIVSVEPSEPALILQRGESIKFQCKATGFPEPKIVWTRKGRKLPSDHREHRGDHLHFAHVRGRHSGVYVCRASNDLGAAEHAFNLTISDEPEIEFEKDMINTNLGEIAQISCIVHAYPPAKVTWFHGSEEVRPSSRTMVSLDEEFPENGSGRRYFLQIAGVTKNDLGTYFCLAGSDTGTARRAIKLSGTPAPAVLHNVTYDSGLPILYWTVESLAPITKHELMYRRKDPVSDWSVVEFPANKTDGNIYQVRYLMKDVETAEYEAKLRSHNSFGWSDLSQKYPFTAEAGNGAPVQKAGNAAPVAEAGNGAPVERLSFGLLFGAIAVLLARS